MTDPSFSLLLLLFVLVDIAAAAACIFARGSAGEEPAGASPAPPRIGPGRLLLAAFVAAALSALKIPLLVALGGNPFGVIHLAYLDLVVGAPVIGILVIAAGLRRAGRRGARRLTRPAWALAAAAVSLAGVGFHASFIEPLRLQLEQATLVLPPGRAGRTPLRIGVLADLQMRRVTAHERRAVVRLLEEKPDLILLPGDIFQGGAGELERELPALRDLLGQLTAPGGVYLVRGNTDQSREWIERMV
ncbi:MAG: metallophosphoesterase, partial [Planctomycetes bacterium]|nr:metallophosphoesterase [Planctomycetota bacterium]